MTPNYFKIKNKFHPVLSLNHILFHSRSILFLSLIFIANCANSDNKHLDDIRNSLNKRAIAIIYKINNDDKTSEQYADWSVNLNDFTHDNPKKYIVYKASAVIDQALKSSKISHSNNYTLFLKNGKPSYLYDGVIVEHMVYMANDEAYTKSSISPMSKVFLPDIINLAPGQL